MIPFISKKTALNTVAILALSFIRYLRPQRRRPMPPAEKTCRFPERSPLTAKASRSLLGFDGAKVF